MKQGGDIRMAVVFDFICGLAHTFVWTCALAFGGGDEEIVALNGDGAGVPIGGDEAERGGGGSIVRMVRVQVGCVEYGHCVGGRVGHEELLSVSGLGQRAGISPGVLLTANCGVQESEDRGA